MSGTIVRAIDRWSHLKLTATQWESCYYYSHFTDRNTWGTVTCLQSCSYWYLEPSFELKKLGSEVHCWNHYIMLPFQTICITKVFHTGQAKKIIMGNPQCSRKRGLKVRLMHKTCSPLWLVHVWGLQGCFRCQTLQALSDQPSNCFGDIISVNT